MSGKWQSELERALESFERRFWSDELGHLYDVVDVDHVRGSTDESFRPNQVFAVGGLELCLISAERACKVIDRVEEKLVTPLGLRSLSPDDPRYAGRYLGDLKARDESYHQGTVWPWLMGAFVEAWVRARGATSSAKAEARARFIAPLRAHLEQAGLGHVSEIADGDPPHAPRGCPFQAWSVAELLRLERRVLVR
jgi:glycogen debranching enzyme